MTEDATTSIIDATSAILQLALALERMPRFMEGGVYRDSVGRRWKVRETWYGGSILMLKRVHRPWSETQVAVVDEGAPWTATVLLAEGFTTIYADKGDLA